MTKAPCTIWSLYMNLRDRFRFVCEFANLQRMIQVRRYGYAPPCAHTRPRSRHCSASLASWFADQSPHPTLPPTHARAHKQGNRTTGRSFETQEFLTKRAPALFSAGETARRAIPRSQQRAISHSKSLANASGGLAQPCS